MLKKRDNLFADLSNDSYGTVVNMGLDGEGASPGGGGNGAGGGPPRGYLGATTPPYLSTSRSPSLPPQFPYPPDAGLSVYTTLGKARIVDVIFFENIVPSILSFPKSVTTLSEICLRLNITVECSAVNFFPF